MNDKARREAYWREHVSAWRASESERRLTRVAELFESQAQASASGLSIATPNGWRLDFPELPPASWLSAFWSGAR